MTSAVANVKKIAGSPRAHASGAIGRTASEAILKIATALESRRASDLAFVLAAAMAPPTLGMTSARVSTDLLSGMKEPCFLAPARERLRDELSHSLRGPSIGAPRQTLEALDQMRLRPFAPA